VIPLRLTRRSKSRAISAMRPRSFCDFDAVFDAGFLQVQIAL
jgi:hypothetical protein